VRHQAILVDVASGEAIVAALKGHAVVPDDAGDVDLAIQVLVALVIVQAVLECLANRGHHRYCSTYVLTEQVEQHTYSNSQYGGLCREFSELSQEN